MAKPFIRNLKNGPTWTLKVQLQNGTWKNYNSKKLVAFDHEGAPTEASLNWAERKQAEIQKLEYQGEDPFGKQINSHADFENLVKDFTKVQSRYWTSGGTRDLYERTFRLFRELTKIKSIHQITVELLEKFVDRLETRGVVNAKGVRVRDISEEAINIHLRNLNCLFRWVKESRFRNFHIPRIRQLTSKNKKKFRDFFTPSEVEHIIRASKDFFYYIGTNGRNRHKTDKRPIQPLIATLFDTGVRLGEGLGLRRSMIDEDRCIIVIEGSKTKQGGIVVVSQYVLKCLPRGEECFAGLRQNNVRTLWYEILKAAGIKKKLKIHNTRDSFVQNHLFEGKSLAAIIANTRHSVKVMQKHYIFLGNDEAVIRGIRGQKKGEYDLAIKKGLGLVR